MYPSSTSSSSQGSMGPNGGSNNSGLFRYGSAPSSLLSTAVDSVISSTREFAALGSHSQHLHLHMGPMPTSSSSRFFPSSETSSLTSESTCKTSNKNDTGLQRAYGLKQEGTIGGGGGAGMVSSSSTTSSPLIRHSSSPAGFLNHLPHSCISTQDNGFPTARGRSISRLNSQLSFTRQETLSQISEGSENVDNGLNAENDKRKSTHSYTTFQFRMPQTILEMSSMDKLLNIPEDSVPCKIRAKRGCATHPRSIAERERRTRISGKLKNLQDLVPNMDKQTSYADMLDLAVQHIKGLQIQVQKLNKELENCTCGCRKPRNACGDEKS